MKPYILVRACAILKDIDHETLDDLEREVNVSIAEGYVPLGAPFLYKNGVAQAMVNVSKIKEDKNENSHQRSGLSDAGRLY